MLSKTILEMVIIFLLILAKGFFAASETAMVSARRGRLKQQADAGNKSAQKALELKTHPTRFYATSSVGMTFIATFTAAFVRLEGLLRR